MTCSDECCRGRRDAACVEPEASRFRFYMSRAMRDVLGITVLTVLTMIAIAA